MLELLNEHACFGGVQRFYRHDSSAIGLPMRFSVYLPPGHEGKRLPVLFYLAGLTCTEETFMIKAGAQRVAAEEGLILVAPDTSPRGAGVAGESDNWDFGVGAGFYVDALEGEWARHYRTATSWSCASWCWPSCRPIRNAPASSAIRWAAMARS